MIFAVGAAILYSGAAHILSFPLLVSNLRYQSSISSTEQKYRHFDISTDAQVKRKFCSLPCFYPFVSLKKANKMVFFKLVLTFLYWFHSFSIHKVHCFLDQLVGRMALRTTKQRFAPHYEKYVKALTIST